MTPRPTWVANELAEILGFDKATVEEAILPELESQNHQSRLQSHLQDFLGPSPKARSFINKYINLRFPSIPTPTPAAPTPLKPYHTPGTLTSSRPASPSFKGPSPFDDARPKSASGSGTSTPLVRPRSGGATTIIEAKEKSKGKSRAATPIGTGSGSKIWDLPKSEEVKRLEMIKDNLVIVQDGGKVNRENSIPDCFCQARNHTLSSYTPHCPHCGLILCSLQAPYLPCPSCRRPFYSSAQLARLIHRVQNDIDSQLALEQSQREADEREQQAKLLAESGGGAFPTLPTAAPQRQVASGQKVLTIGRGGKSKLTTTYHRPAAPSPTPSPGPSIPTDIVPRPRSQPIDPVKAEKEWVKVTDWRKSDDRPWGDLQKEKKGEGWKYVELPISVWVEEDAIGRRKAAKMKKNGIGENGRIVPGAAVG